MAVLARLAGGEVANGVVDRSVSERSRLRNLIRLLPSVVLRKCSPRSLLSARRGYRRASTGRGADISFSPFRCLEAVAAYTACLSVAPALTGGIG